jgi:hypothetical protein
MRLLIRSRSIAVGASSMYFSYSEAASFAEAAEQPSPTQDISETLQTLQTLMLRMIGQGESTSQMQSVSLELLQEAVAEARSGKMNVWEFLVAPGLSDKGKSTGEIAQLFDVQNEDAKDYAYALAEEIKRANQDTD